MYLCRAIVLTLAISFSILGQANAAPLTNKDRNAMIVKFAGIVIDLREPADYAAAQARCKDVQRISESFDPDDAAQGLVDNCFAFIAESQHDNSAACKLRTSEIMHYERVMSTGSEKLKKSLLGSLADAKKSRTALLCE